MCMHVCMCACVHMCAACVLCYATMSRATHICIMPNLACYIYIYIACTRLLIISMHYVSTNYMMQVHKKLFFFIADDLCIDYIIWCIIYYFIVFSLYFRCLCTQLMATTGHACGHVGMSAWMQVGIREHRCASVRLRVCAFAHAYVRSSRHQFGALQRK